LKISLVNLTGQIVFSDELPSFTGVYQRDISVSSLPAGIYFMEIKTQSGSTNKKIVVK
jgi:hypothetical protein